MEDCEEKVYEYISIEEFAKRILDDFPKCNPNSYEVDFTFLPKKETKTYKNIVYCMESSIYRAYKIAGMSSALGNKFLAIGNGIEKDTEVLHDPTIGQGGITYLIDSLYSYATNHGESTDGIVIEKPKSEKDGIRSIYVCYSITNSIHKWYDVTEKEYEMLLNGDISIAEFVDDDLFGLGLGEVCIDEEDIYENGEHILGGD